MRKIKFTLCFLLIAVMILGSAITVSAANKSRANNTITIEVGEQTRLAYSLPGMIWSSSDSSVASVSRYGGVITGISEGDANITLKLLFFRLGNWNITVKNKEEHTHVWDSGVFVKQPTCNSEGIKKYTCTGCSETKTDTVPADNTKHFITTKVVNPTCTEEGKTIEVCTSCNTVINETSIPPKGHTEKSEYRESTCVKAGYNKTICSECGEVLNEKVIEPSGHTWNNGVITSEPTCSANGIKTYTCEKCGETKTENISADASKHNIISETMAATCTTPGKVVEKCSICGTVTKETPIDALGHKEVVDKGVDATCTNKGLTEGKHCSVCGEVTLGQKEIPALGHIESSEHKDATELEDGYDKVICTVCGEVISETTIPAIGHTWDSGVVTREPDCTNKGIKIYTCKDCGQTKEENIDTDENNHKVVINTTEATCTESGKTVESCELCEKVLSEEIIEALGHTESTEFKNATATEDGYRKTTCSVCKEVLSEEIIPATGHTWDNGVITTEANCITEGIKTYTCTVCGETKTESVGTDSTKHNTITETTESTCKEVGAIIEKCLDCETIISESEIELKEHSWDDGVVTIESTCKNKGEKTYTCNNCGTTKVESIEENADNHNITIETVRATCTENGKTIEKCKDCDYVKSETIIEAVGHKEKTEHKDATEVEEGYDRVICSVCGTVISETIIPVVKPVVKKSATLVSGPEINVKMKYLSGTVSELRSSYTYNTFKFGYDRDYGFLSWVNKADNTIVAFKRSSTAPDMGKMGTANTISTSNSETPIYMWFDNGTIYYWTEATEIKAGNDLSGLFAYMSVLEDISGVEDWNTSNAEKLVSTFACTYHLIDLSPIKNWNVSKVNDMTYMMYRIYEDDDANYQLKDLSPISGWNTSSVQFLDNAFMGMQYVEDLTPLRNWDTSSVTSMGFTFNHFHSLKSLAGLENWDVSNVVCFECTFQHAHILEDISAVANWNTSSAKTMKGLWRSNRVLADWSPLSNWDVSNVEIMGGPSYGFGMFSYNYGITNLDFMANWNVSNLKQTGSMFTGCNALTDISGLKNWNTVNLLDTYEMFIGCTGLTNLSGLENWNTSNLINPAHMFDGCRNLTDISALAKWSMSSTIDVTRMFKNCSGLTDISALANWKLTCDNISQLFYGCSGLTDVSVLNDWDTSKIITAKSTFEACSKLTTYPSWSGTWNNGTFTSELAASDTKKDLNDCTVNHLHNMITTGTSPSVTIKDGEYTLVKDKDYTLEYRHNTTQGRAYVIIRGKGNYKGTVLTNYNYAGKFTW